VTSDGVVQRSHVGTEGFRSRATDNVKTYPAARTDFMSTGPFRVRLDLPAQPPDLRVDTAVERTRLTVASGALAFPLRSPDTLTI